MSGILGLVAFEGRPVDASLLQNLTEAMAYRGPDGQHWCGLGDVGLGHGLFAVGPRQRRERQPLIEGELAISADARIDDRQRLARELGQPELAGAGDASLILHAYRVWQESCVEHLIGDFSFVLWDQSRGRLFAARDPVGVKPLYYVPSRTGLAISNTLHVLRRHPEFSLALNELALADFLLFGSNQDLNSTFFRHIRRLPPGHFLCWQKGETMPRIDQYWSWPRHLPTEKRRHEGDVERFRELLQAAVADRVTEPTVTVFMSGGMDSTAVAALARQELERCGEPYDLRAQTVVYKRLIDDPEGPFAARAAESIGIPIHFLTADHYRRLEGWNHRFQPPEPVDGHLLPLNDDLYRLVASQGRLALTGDGGDIGLQHPSDHLLRQIRHGRLDQALTYLLGSLIQRRHLPPLGLRTLLQQRRRKRHWREGFPEWLDAEFVRRNDLLERWRTVRSWADLSGQGEREEAFSSLEDPAWCAFFEAENPGATGFLVENRYPFFDLRLLNFALRLPASWCLDKRLLREAMDGILPPDIRLRPKAPLAGSPKHEIDAETVEPLTNLHIANESFLQYVVGDKPTRMLNRKLLNRKLLNRKFEQAAKMILTGSSSDLGVIRALGLVHWLTNLDADEEGDI